MDDDELRAAAAALTDWYGTHARPLPWRQEVTPYRVWISEIMLQQTRIEAVRPYFARFMREIPDVRALAAVPDDRLLKLWEGLGYYSRARNLKKAAIVLCRDYGGELPPDYDRLLTLPGIGPYTAGAIAAIAYGLPVPAVDGNVMRVLSRLTGDGTDVLSDAGKKHFFSVAQAMLPTDMPGRFDQALMELGETVCLPKGQPLCGECPLSARCAARRDGRTEELPVRAKKKPRRVEQRTVCIAVICGEDGVRRVLLHRRAEKGLLAGLWELPNVLTDGDGSEAAARRALPPGASVLRDGGELPQARHIFTHIEWHMSARLLYLPPFLLPPGFRAATADEVRERYPLPSAFKPYAALLPQILTD